MHHFLWTNEYWLIKQLKEFEVYLSYLSDVKDKKLATLEKAQISKFLQDEESIDYINIDIQSLPTIFHSNDKFQEAL